MPNEQLVLTAPDGSKVRLAQKVSDESQPGFLPDQLEGIRQLP